MRQKFIGIGGVLGSVVLAGCGINATVTPANNSTSQVSGTVHASEAPSTNPSSSSRPSSPASVSSSTSGPPSSSPTTSPTKTSTTPHSSPAKSNTLSPITYTANQQATIFELGHQAGFPAAYVPREGFHSTYVKATVFTAATSHKTVLMLTYNNFTVQESGTMDSFGSGGNHATTGSAQLTIPGSGSRVPIMGTWTTDYGIQGSGTHSFLTFRMNGVYYDIMSLSNTLSEAQINTIADSFSET
ncbi:MAG: hypothetical protein M1294_02040 [Firmicutes bacterium]|uniref:DUF4367 domain-containing protein n=1 Tax=Sulfobacillus benefaciens TaxID=453960 RepID=A0A2T2WRL9_9FIRM|nr:hypothetical protein [Bacillota bacterium]MCL5012958.1 hypothetical protein [Bacillota bacterium]PSR24894.1 MAG: hypothetical protein C7B43_18030 [Sulfobacillus benefaciens]